MERLKSKWWIGVCGILIIFTWVNGFAFERVKFAVLADPHLGMAVEGIKDEFKMTVSSCLLLRNAVKELNKIPDLDFVVLCGDLTLDAEPWNLEMLKTILDELRAPYYIVLGNHDLSPVPLPRKFPGPPPARGVTRAEFVWAFQGHGYSGPDYWWSCDPIPGLHLIGLDTNLPGSWGGHIPEAEKRWLERDLFANKDKLTIVFAHHNFVPWHKDDASGVGEGSWKDYGNFLVDNAEEIRAIFEKYPNVCFVMSGHRHIGLRYKELNGVYYFVHPAVCSYPMRYTVYTLTYDELSWESKDIPAPADVWKRAKENCIGEPGKWWRCSDHPETPEGDKKMLEFFEAKEYMKGKVPVRFKPGMGLLEKEASEAVALQY
ncbi:MAG TPA: metallophosphoesterase [Deltaproteobacteria bacterium]|nr:metallophosphoesterase [Deltaproteobacteria bacterium]